MSQMMRKQKRSVLLQKTGMKTRDLGQGIRAVMYESSLRTFRHMNTPLMDGTYKILRQRHGGTGNVLTQPICLTQPPEQTCTKIVQSHLLFEKLCICRSCGGKLVICAEIVT